MEIIVGRKGNQSFSITDKSVSSKHLKLTTMPNGDVLVEDLGSTNGTFIDGIRIVKKTVPRNTVVRMGANYSFRIDEIFPEVHNHAAGQSNANQASKPECSIAHLEEVWNEYEQTLAEITKRAQELGKKRMLPMMVGMASGALSPILATLLSIQTLFITVPISLICLIMYIYAYNQKDTSVEDRKEAKAKYIKHYVCPNPECHHYVGGLGEYIVLRQNSHCPYCKCKWTTTNS